MTDNDVKNILTFLRGCYPAFYRNTTDEEMSAIRIAWLALFADPYYTHAMVFEAVRQCVAGKLRVRDGKGMGTREATDGAYRKFPPQPGVIAEALEEEREIGYYARRLQAERERRRLRARQCESLPGGVDNGQQDENRMVYAYVEPGRGLSAGLPVLLRPGAGEPLRDE